MTTPITDGPATVSAVAGWLSIPDGHDELGYVAAVVPAVNSFVRRLHGDTDWSADVVQGAVMLAARLTRRRNSPAGVESFGELGATYVSRYDPDLDRLLGLGAHRRLIVG